MTVHISSLPYQGMSSTVDLLEATQMIWQSTRRDMPGSHTIDFSKIDTIVGLELNIHSMFVTSLDCGLSELGLTLSDLDLVVVARYPNIYRSVLVYVGSASNFRTEGSLSIPFTNSIDMQSGPTDVQVALVLKSDRTESRIRPWMKGTVISTASFIYKSRNDLGGLDLIPLDKVKCDELVIPIDTEVYVRFKDSPLEASGLEALEVFVSSDILSILEANTSSTASVSLLSRITYEVLSQTITRGSLELRSLEIDRDSVVGSLYDRILCGIAAYLGEAEEVVFSAAADDSQSGRIAAYAQTYCGLKNKSLKTLKNGGSQ